MEINVKVSVEGVIRDVCGVNEATTCEEVIFKLAQAACLPGFYTLVAKHYAGETTLAPEDKLINFIRNLGEKPANVHFVLCRLEAQSMQTNRAARAQQQPPPPQQQARLLRPPAVRSGAVSRTERQRQPATTITTTSSSSSSSLSPHSKTIASAAVACLSPASRSAAGSDSRPAVASAVVANDASADQVQYAQLEDQLASQEHEVELNRIRLLQLDKTIESLEHANRMAADASGLAAVGPAAELAQLTATPWPQLLEANKARQLDLVRERERYQLAIEQLDGQLAKSLDEATKTESRVGQELQHLLANLESVNAHRRQLLRSVLSPSSRTSARGRALTAKDVDGVAV